MGKRLDELAKSLANNKLSRRQALMRAVGGAGAAAVAAFLPGKALADNNTLQQSCIRFCEQMFPTSGVLSNPCTRYEFELCVAEASMRQGPCFFFNGGPGYRQSCSYTGVCPPGQVCCNGRCCQPDLCGEFSDQFVFNGTRFVQLNGNPCLNVNGSTLYFNGHPWIAGTGFTEVCLGC